ncbi:septum site-determining protein MinC [Bradyrhizobium sp. LM2.7]
MEAAARPQRQLVRLRGRSYVAFVFVPTVPVQDWLQEIDATIARSPGFFAGRPVVIDLSSVDLSQSGISHLLASLQDRNIRVLGIEGVEVERLTAAMPPLLSGGRSCVVEPSAPKKAETKTGAKPTSLLLESPVRSGQTIIFPEGDVTILGSVGSGAEVVAGGSIHVYGALRGPRHGGGQRARERPHLLSEDRGRTACNRWILSDCRRYRRRLAWPACPGLAPGQHHANYSAELTS